MPYIAQHDPKKCTRCESCFELVACPGAEEEICIGCGACALSCPNQAIEMVEEDREREITIEVDGRVVRVPERISVREALSWAGYRVSGLPTESDLFVSCEVGACWGCVVEIDGVARPACVTAARDGMKVRTKLAREYVPRRVISGFRGHPVGGVGTPWHLRRSDFVPIEVVSFTAGCNFRCPQCQNWRITYDGKSQALTPGVVARTLTAMRGDSGVDRMTLSGGECTLNRPWLVQCIRELRALNPDREAHFHVDTNGSLLTPGYIDELVEAGMTDVGIDLKALEPDTFMRIAGLNDRGLVQRYKDIAWEAVKYITDRHKGRVFLGIGIPYNRDLISLEEIERMGNEIYRIDPAVQVCVNNYRGEFRSRIIVPTSGEMKIVHETLKATGLTSVICQTSHGFIDPFS